MDISLSHFNFANVCRKYLANLAASRVKQTVNNSSYSLMGPAGAIIPLQNMLVGQELSAQPPDRGSHITSHVALSHCH